MDHKEFFDEFGELNIQIMPSGGPYYTANELYQAFKQRLIEELRIDFGPFADKHLIDATEQLTGDGP